MNRYKVAVEGINYSLIFSWINPKYLVLDDTRGMKEYKDCGFHFAAALKGLKLSVVLLLLALLCYGS